MNPNSLLIEQAKIVPGFGPATPTSASTVWVSMKNASRIAFVLQIANGGTPVPAAVALQQAKTVAGGSAKALPFTIAYRALDTATSDVMAAFTVSANTFTPDNTASKTNLYVVEVRADELDVNNDFDCVQMTIATATGLVAGVTIFLWPSRYGKIGQGSASVD